MGCAGDGTTGPTDRLNVMEFYLGALILQALAPTNAQEVDKYRRNRGSLLYPRTVACPYGPNVT
jgi:hypothetical protein